MEELVKLVQELNRRIDQLERQLDLKNIVLPPDGQLIVDNRASDPVATKGRIYFNTTLNKYRVSEDGIVFRTITTT